MTKSDRSKKSYWRSLNEVEFTPEFEQLVHREFPDAATEFPEGVSRRRWMQLMGASLALGAAGCRYQEEVIATFSRRPDGRVPGETRRFATVLELQGIGVPAIATSFDGRPIKLDGHPTHPDTLGGSNVLLQAAVLDLYDPDRSRAPRNSQGESSWAEFLTAWSTRLAGRATGAKVAVLGQRSSSPSLIAALTALGAKYSELKYYEHDAAAENLPIDGAVSAFGQRLRPVYSLDSAKVLVSIDADPLGTSPSGIRDARGWMKARDVERRREDSSFEPGRLYAVESQMSVTGMCADHRIAIKSSRIEAFVSSLVKAVQEALASGHAAPVEGEGKTAVFRALVDDLIAHQGAGAIVISGRAAPAAQAAVHALNVALGNVGEGKPIGFVEARDTTQLSAGSLADLVREIQAGAVDTLVVLGGNPVFDAPQDVDFAAAFGQVEERVYFGLYENETSAASTWHLNATHALEAWGDARSISGSYCLAQPLIAPLWGGHSALELVDALTNGSLRSGEELVRATSGASSRDAWLQLVHGGFDSAAPTDWATLSAPQAPALPADDAWLTAKPAEENGELEVVLTPSTFLLDGRNANNGWLQECPDPTTKLVWGNAALVAPSTAKQLGIKQNTIVEVSVNGSTIELPAHLMPGQARGSIGVALGFGRTEVGLVGGSEKSSLETVGVNAYPLLRAGSRGVLTGASVKPTDRPHVLACTQDHYAIDELGLQLIHNRVGKLVRDGEWSDLRLMIDDFQAWSAKHIHTVHHESEGAEGSHDESQEGGEAAADSHDTHGHHAPWPYVHEHFEARSLNPGPALSVDGPKWGMSIDLNKCTGCHACVVACQAENNIPVVGRDQVIRGRLLHWLRVDRYYIGDPAADGTGFDFDEPTVFVQPVTCHHCENAPCEQVCPVAATVHSDEGLNDMIYNRCVGTRYCGNNCPYKVRRFNYLNYTEAVTFVKYPWADKLSPEDRALRNLVMNPEVTVRSRGVMEKCTYCVQRIQNGKIAARREGRELTGDEITTACQDACPTDAIVFGDLNMESRVKAGHDNPRAYEMLGELNVKARTRYLARVRNSHPALAGEATEEHAGH
ncbi:MAG: TAT-variant-translocated molybdopterin oxidoreductase [Pirellulaceae bacterium]